jgi:hypothetical protein
MTRDKGIVGVKDTYDIWCFINCFLDTPIVAIGIDWLKSDDDIGREDYVGVSHSIPGNRFKSTRLVLVKNRLNR